MTISFNELIKDKVLTDVSHTQQLNLERLRKALNVVRAAYGKPMYVTSGLRTMQEHLRIYSAKGMTDRTKIPMQSAHLSGEAADFADPRQELQKWCLENVAVLEQEGLYCEDFAATATWVHFQIRAPRSGNRFFKP